MTRRAPAAALLAALVGASLGGCTAFDVPRPVDPGPPPTVDDVVDDVDREPIWEGAFAMTVVEVVDGDTLQLRLDRSNDVVTTTSPISVRLIGIDTPEVYPEEECFGQEAEAALGLLAGAGATVYVAPDVESWDPYNRRLFYVWTPDGLLINEELARGGYAEVRRYPPNTTLHERLEDAESEARSAGRGLWGAC